MTEPTLPASIVLSRDHASVPSAPALHGITPVSDTLDDETRAQLAQAGHEALEACLDRLAPAERAAFWFAISRCYNRPYNPPEARSGEIAGAPSDELPPGLRDRRRPLGPRFGAGGSRPAMSERAVRET